MKLKIIWTVKHDGETYAPDDTADIPDKQALRLIETGAAVMVSDKPKIPASDGKEKDELMALSSDELKELAASLNVTGKNKSELSDAIIEARRKAEAGE